MTFTIHYRIGDERFTEEVEVKDKADALWFFHFRHWKQNYWIKKIEDATTL